MNLKSVLVSIMAILSSQITQAGESHLIVPVSDLEDLGISAKAIQEEFYNRHQVNIDWDEYLKVSKENEGKEIRFETYDNFSTIVPIARAHGTFNKKGTSYQLGRKNLKTLSYVLAFNKVPITLDLYEAERYAPAVVVQQLVGNLVYYSNNGRYEPRISESWQRVSSKQWDFKIKKGYTCENGELITASSFKQSLIRSLKVAAKQGNVPVFNKLEGFDDLIEGKSDFPGIVATEDTLSFKFSENTRSGPLQILSFAPFGYICAENLNPDLTWKDKSKFISSGPYKVDKIDIGNEYILSKRKDWPDFAPRSPEKVIITHKVPEDENTVQSNMIVDSFSEIESLPQSLKHYPLVPEYLSSILLGDINKGFFSKLENRKALDNAIQEAKKKLRSDVSTLAYSPFFYPSQKRVKALIVGVKTDAPIKPLVIEGKLAVLGNARLMAFKILAEALDSLNWNYVFKNNEYSWKDSSDPNIDIRIESPSVGGGVEAWGIDILYYSPVGPNLPDPSGRIKKMLAEYENDKITDEQMAEQFINVVEEDAAVIPIGHYGIQWYISSGIDTRSISPLISVVRFDQVELE